MPRHSCLMAAVFTISATASTAEACRITVPLDLSQVKHADTVVVGRILDYRLVLDQKARARRATELARPGLSAGERQYLSNQTMYDTDLARIDIQVKTVLRGRAVNRLTATVDAGALGYQYKPNSGSFLIALYDPHRTKDVQAPSTFTVMTQPCAGSFILPQETPQAAEITRRLRE